VPGLEAPHEDDDDTAALSASLLKAGTTATGMSWGKIASPPRRAMVSAMRLPETAVMFAATKGSGVASPSVEVRSTSSRDATSERFGTMNTSE